MHEVKDISELLDWLNQEYQDACDRLDRTHQRIAANTNTSRNFEHAQQAAKDAARMEALRDVVIEVRFAVLRNPSQTERTQS